MTSPALSPRLLPRHLGRVRPAGLGLAFAALPLAAPALAQERDPFAPRPPLPLLREDVAGTRQIPAYAAPGIHLGGLLVSPEVTLRADADSNVLNRRLGKRGDTAFTLAPAFRAAGELGRASVSFGAHAAVTRQARLSGQNRETFGADVQASVPLGPVLQLGLAAGWSRKQEPNYGAGAAEGDSATLYQQLEGSLGLSASFGLTRLSARLDLDRLDYQPITRAGTAVDQSFRDQRAITAVVRAERALPAGHTLFLQGSHRWTDSLHPAPCCERTARGGEVVAGVRGDLTHLISAEIAGGYQWRTYHSAAFRDYRGAAFRARIEWYATPLVSLALGARRDIVDSGLPTAAGVVVDSARVELFYEAKRNLNLVATAALGREKYRDDVVAGLSARSASAGVEARYALSGRYLVGAYARTRNRSSDSTLLPRQGSAVEGGLWLRVKM